jgi:hypothetical protein
MGMLFLESNHFRVKIVTGCIKFVIIVFRQRDVGIMYCIDDAEDVED